MSLTLEQAVGQKLLWGFAGTASPPAELIAALRRHPLGGVSLFRTLNVVDPAQIRQLTAALQRIAHAAGQPLLLIAADQEGGQLLGLGHQTTPFPGNMALGAARSAELARRVGWAIGRELAALGVNLNYAPVCDVNVNPQNPVVGIRSFGESPELVARLAAAMIAGLQSAGVAATAKHFPGHGDVSSDSHYGLPSVPHSRERLQQIEWVPFAAAIRSGVQAIMTAHLAVPGLDDQPDRPATLSPVVLRDLLRDELHFDGVIITDAMDMQAIQQGAGLGEAAIKSIEAGADLLLLTNFIDQANVYDQVLQAAQRGRLSSSEVLASAERVLRLKAWIAAQPPQPSLEVVGCTEHQALADEVANQSITLVRDEAHLLPLQLSPDARVLVIVPQPRDLTPADTSSYVTPSLAAAVRAHHPRVDELLAPYSPTEADIAGLRAQARQYDLIIVGTINAARESNQAALVNELLRLEVPTIVVAQRLPYDLIACPSASTYLCTYSILEPSMRSLARALWGEIELGGHLPVSIPQLYPIGHGLALHSEI
jgi:beta-N-acetylhexosaminidase